MKTIDKIRKRVITIASTEEYKIAKYPKLGGIVRIEALKANEIAIKINAT